MSELKELIEMADQAERVFAPELASSPWNDDRYRRLLENVDRLACAHSVHQESSTDLGRLMLKRQISQEAAALLLEIFLISKDCDVDLQSAVEESLFRKMRGRDMTRLELRTSSLPVRFL